MTDKVRDAPTATGENGIRRIVLVSAVGADAYSVRSPA